MSTMLKILLALACAVAIQVASAQTYPDRPIRLIVPYPPGSSTNDILGRALAGRLTVELGNRSSSTTGRAPAATWARSWSRNRRLTAIHC